MSYESSDSGCSSSSSLTSEDPPCVALVDEEDKQQRLAVLSFEQVRRLDTVMQQVVQIHGRGNFPTLEVRLRDLVSLVRTKLEADDVHVKDIRLNGGAASHVLAHDAQTYNDLDLIFAVELPTARIYERVGFSRDFNFYVILKNLGFSNEWIEPLS
jgi:terminal nucleotidyltransferase 5A/B